MTTPRRPLAIMPAYNEADIIRHTIQYLYAQGCDVHVIDNWSTDRTPWAVAQTSAYMSAFPSTPQIAVQWADLLHEVEKIAALPENIGRWVMFNDADEIRRAPGGLRLDEWFWASQSRGFNAVQFTVRNYVPTSDLWDGSQDPESFFRYYERSVLDNRLPHVKAWYSSGQRVDLHSSGGHVAKFHWMQVDPVAGLLKHYPIRSQHHGQRKVFRERNLRWSADEKRRGWHQQYEHMQPGYSFVRSITDPALIYDSEHEVDELSANAGLVQATVRT